MKKTIIKHLTVTGFIKETDLTDYEVLENNLYNAKMKLTDAKKDVKEAKKKLNLALEKSIKKIDIEKNRLNTIKGNGESDVKFSSVLKIEDIQSQYAEIIFELELKKDEIKKKIEEYKADGSENWELFKDKLKHDLEELGRALKGFTTPAN